MALKLMSYVRNAKTRTLIIFAGGTLLVGLVIALSTLGNKDPLKKRISSSIGAPKDIDPTPGRKTSEKYRKLQQEDNRLRAAKAKESGGSSIPTIIGGTLDDALDNPSTSDNNADEMDDFLNALENRPQPSKSTQQRRIRDAAIEQNPQLKALLKQQEELAAEESRLRRQQENEYESDRVARLSAQQQKKIQEVMGAMDGHAKSIFSAWNTVNPQSYVQGDEIGDDLPGNGGNVDNNDNSPDAGATGATILKAGDILFAVLDTAVNTDEPSPIMASVIQGKYKGAKLIGTVEFNSNNTRSQKVVLNFNRMSIVGQPTSITIKAVAIDPSTARTALASDVDNHYLLRYGSLFASAFLDGYSKSITESGTTTTTAADGGATTNTKPSLSGKEQLMAGFGEIGKKWGEKTGDNFNTPPTVKVDAGIGLGLLFLSDVKA